MKRTGVLFIGALGYVATTVMAGTAALKKSLCSRTGMVTDLELFSGLDLKEPWDFVMGGWDIRPGTPLKSMYEFLGINRLLAPAELGAIENDMVAISSNLFAGTTENCGRAILDLAGQNANISGTLQESADRLRGDIRTFKQRNELDSVIVVNVASTEPPITPGSCHETISGLENCIESNNRGAIRASTLYSYAAVSEGCPYINFTPSNGALIPAILELAAKKRVPVMGNDGKTGETVVKSTLAPMFASRNLEVMSWEGFNILGNMDGKVLEDPENKASKIITKDKVVSRILGYAPHTKVHINYVPSLDDQKTAWNFIHFKGFLGVKMSMQFIWQGYDSILAAPLVIDLIRLAELSLRREEAGIMAHLGFFFKSPLGMDEQRLSEQYRALLEYVANIKAATPPAVERAKEVA